jgi:uncharacterized SAM-binding protein YcdF (DUF218 family)
MHAGETATYVAASFLLPPTSLLLLALCGLWLARSRVRLGIGLTTASLLLLLLLSTGFVAQTLLRTLEVVPPADLRAADAQAIVILAGGRNRGALEWGGGETLSAFSLQRVRYGARLANATGLPVLVTGGNPERALYAEATLMRDALEREFDVRVRWVEDKSDTTADNAHLSAPLLRAAGIKRILLVTDAWHMPRALPLFEREGLTVVPAPMGYLGQRAFRWQMLVPSAEGLRQTSLALREWLAIVYYRWRA